MAHQLTIPGRGFARASLLTRFRRWEASGVLIALLVLCIVLALATPNFFTLNNLPIVLRNASFVGLVALGQTLVLLVGGIDQSVGAAAGLSAIVGALMLTKLGIHPYAIIPLTMMFGQVGMPRKFNVCELAAPSLVNSLSPMKRSHA